MRWRRLKERHTGFSLRSPEAKAREENIILGELPSHTSNWTQPFDRCVFKSLKCAWNKEVDNFVKETGVSLGHSQFLRLFGRAWKASVTTKNIFSGFRATGILPFNPDVIPTVAFKPSETTTSVTSGVSASTVRYSIPSSAAKPQPHTLDNVIHVTSCGDNTDCLPSEGLQENSPDPFLPVVYDVCFENGSTGSEINVVYLPHTLDSSNYAGENVGDDFPSENMSVVSDATALQVIESALSPDTLAKYCVAHLSGPKIDDKLFETWEMYRSKESNSLYVPLFAAATSRHSPAKATSKTATATAQPVMDQVFPLPKPNLKPESFSIINSEVILTQSPNVVFENTAVTQTCRYNGGLTITAYIWRRNGDTIGVLVYNNTSGECSPFTQPNSTHYEYRCPDRNRVTLTVLNVTQSNNGDVWHCEFTLDGGPIETSNSYTIIVHVPVTSVDIIEPTSTTVNVKENTVQLFNCRTSISQPTPEIKWYLADGSTTPDKLITDNIQQTPSQNVTVLRATTSSLTYRPTRQVNGWQLYCSAQNIKSSIKLLNVTYPPNDTRIDSYLNTSTYYVIAGKQQILTCRSKDGNPLATLHWSCFTGSSSDSTTGTTVTSQWRWTTNVGGKCTCVSGHIHGNQSYSLNVEILHSSIPEIRYGDVNGAVVNDPLRVVRGHTFTLHCHAASSPESSYSWNRGNYNGQLLTISSLNDDEQVICTATTIMVPTVGSTTTITKYNTVSVVVLKPPTIPVIVYHSLTNINNVDSIRVIEGKTFNISCSSTGQPTPSVSWNNTIPSTTKTFISISKEETGIYSCMAQNSMNTSFDGVVPGTSLNNISINVLYKPVIHPLFNITIVEGNSPSTHIVCQVTPGNPLQTSIKWNRGSMQITSQNGVTSLQLPLNKVQRSADGTYNCTAENMMDPTSGQTEVGRDYKQFQLTVFYDTSIIQFEELYHPGVSVVTVEEGYKTQFQCSVDSKPGSTISITKEKVIKSNRTLTNKVLYTVPNTTCLDTGIYTCAGFNERTGQVSRPSRSLQLHVKCGPRLSPIHTSEFNQTSPLHTTTELQVYIMVYPAPIKPQLVWKKRNGGILIVVNDDRMEKQIATTGIFTRASLLIHDVRQTDFGEYTLHVEHEIYDAVFTLFFYPKDKPSPPTDISYDKVTVTSAVIYWTPGFDGGFVQTFVIMYRKDSEPKWSHEAVVDTNATRMQVILEHLNSGSRYIVRIYATNKLGNSTAHSDVHFATAALASESSKSTAAVIGGAVAGGLVIALVYVLIVLGIRRYQSFKAIEIRPIGKTENENSIIYQNVDNGAIQNVGPIERNAIESEPFGKTENENSNIYQNLSEGAVQNVEPIGRNAIESEPVGETENENSHIYQNLSKGAVQNIGAMATKAIKGESVGKTENENSNLYQNVSRGAVQNVGPIGRNGETFYENLNLQVLTAKPCK